MRSTTVLCMTAGQTCYVEDFKSGAFVAAAGRRRIGRERQQQRRVVSLVCHSGRAAAELPHRVQQVRPAVARIAANDLEILGSDSFIMKLTF